MQDKGRRNSEYGLENYGINEAGTVYWNLNSPELYEMIAQRGEGLFSDHGALIVDTGEHTGRAAKDKAIVREPASEDKVWWGQVNKDFSQEKFNALKERMMAHIKGRDLFVQDTFVGADERYQLPVRIVTELAWHSLFARTMFIRKNGPKHKPEFTVINIPSFTANKSGNYVLELIVNDGRLDSLPVTVTISTLNSRPVADAGADQIAGQSLILLDGTASSDADKDPLSYQ